MRNRNWLRYGLLSLLTVGTGMAAGLQGCSSDSTATDAGADTASTSTTPQPPPPPPGDASQPDTFIPPPPPAAKIIFVHAAAWMGAAFESFTAPDPRVAINGAIRLCLKAGPEASSAFLPVPPLPNKVSAPLPIAALLPGTGGVLPAKTDFSKTRLEGYALNSARLAAKGVGGSERDCGTLFTKGYPAAADAGADAASEALVEGIDFFRVGVIPEGSLTTETTFVVTFEGCAPGAPAALEGKCGPGYDPTKSNFAIKLNKVDRAAVGADQLGAQFVHASTQVAGSPLKDQVLPGIIKTPGDPATFKPFVPTAPSTVAYGSPVTALVKLAGVTVASDFVTVNPGVSALATTFEQGVAATSPKTVVALGKGFTFVAVGDPQAAPTGPSNRLPHFLIFPNDPEVPNLEP